MNILIVGSGGREHALAWKIAQSSFADDIFVAPGNGGTATIAQNIDIKETEIEKLISFAKSHFVDLVIVGPEVPLSLGIVDEMTKENIACFGPSKACAKLEASKSFAKEVMKAANVPTASAEVFHDLGAALEYVFKKGAPLVVKADGLAAGKGVFVSHTQNDVVTALEQIYDGKIGDVGSSVVIEDLLIGEEASLLCFCDGEFALPLPSAQDHKTINEGDTGLNTGGMGAYSPAPVLPDDKLQEVTDIVVRPILKEMQKRGTPFKGILYAGLMMTTEGPKVIEYNVRFGDPECQALMMRLECDLVEILMSCVKGTLSESKLTISPKSALGVVIAAKGYPQSYPKGMEIKNIDTANNEHTVVFHAGTKKEEEKILSNGGRVLCVTALADTLKEAKDEAYKAVEKIEMSEAYYRRDIGDKGLKS